MHDNDDDEKASGDVWSVTSSSKDDSGSGVGDAGGVENIASAAALNDDGDKDDDDNGVDGVDIGCGDDDDVDIGVCDDDVGLDCAVGVHTKLLPHGRFLETENVINIYQTASSTLNSDCIPEVPRGQKDNVYFGSSDKIFYFQQNQRPDHFHYKFLELHIDCCGPVNYNLGIL